VIAALLRALRAALARPPLAGPAADPELAARLAGRLREAGDRPPGPGLALFHVDCGSCNGCELELRLLASLPHAPPGSFAASPRAADAVLVTGPVARNMQGPLGLAWDAAADPKYVVAIGDCAVDGGVFRGSYAVAGGVGTTLPVDLVIRGCPPSPAQILAGLRTLAAAGKEQA
jgi:Ni,Fe-hydrogenase III small subunit